MLSSVAHVSLWGAEFSTYSFETARRTSDPLCDAQQLRLVFVRQRAALPCQVCNWPDSDFRRCPLSRRSWGTSRRQMDLSDRLDLWVHGLICESARDCEGPGWPGPNVESVIEMMTSIGPTRGSRRRQPASPQTPRIPAERRRRAGAHIWDRATGFLRTMDATKCLDPPSV